VELFLSGKFVFETPLLDRKENICEKNPSEFLVGRLHK